MNFIHTKYEWNVCHSVNKNTHNLKQIPSKKEKL